jgi:hypothetical protein
VVLALLFTGLMFYAKTLVSPENMKKMAKEQLEKTFPNAEVEIGELDLGIGFKFTVSGNKLALKLKSEFGGTKLFSVNEIKVKIPLWSIILSGGSASIEIDKPELTYTEGAGNETNWSKAMGTQATTAASSDNKNDEPTVTNQKINLPKQLLSSKLGIKLLDTMVDYRLKDGSSGTVNISKIMFKDINFEGPSAFEVNSQISIVDKNKVRTSFDTLVVGQFNLKDYLHNGDISTIVNLQLQDIKKSNSALHIENIKTDLNLEVKGSGVTHGVVTTTINGASKIEFEFKQEKELIEINKILVNLVLKDMMKMTGSSPPPGVDLSKSNLVLEGKFKKQGATLTPDVKFRLEPELDTVFNDLPINVALGGSVQNTKVKFTFKAKMMAGFVDGSATGDFNFSAPDFNLDKMAPIDIVIAANQLKITKDFIQKKMYQSPAASAPTPSEKAAQSQTPTQVAEATPPKLPALNLKLDFTKIKIDDRDFNAKFLITTRGNTIKTEKGEILYSKGKGNLTHTTTLGKKSKHNFTFKMENLLLDGLNAFLPPSVKGVKGEFNGNVSGDAVTSATSLTYTVNVGVQAKSGEIQGINFTDQIKGIVAKLPVLKDKMGGDKSYNIDGKFETMSLKGVFSEKEYLINDYKLTTDKKQAEIFGSGKVSPPPTNGAGELDFNLKDLSGTISGPLKQNTGLDVLPMKLVGNGFALSPDYEYTAKKLLKGGAQTKGKEILKQKAVELKDKLFNGSGGGESKPDVKNVLKGLFGK